ncbi:hypothetical protein DFQ27_002952 [Actinomortierella ambigua]|uniref:Crinkler effector protein N-terminal domain-containing protein n=1 Tax=Actinomortierella ambigua TaxID=1343610 RepID=A0A9P6U6B5_9FUNG|nr:hypothetical protein DFQ27_002952 [Actinomortierella ambigua]
MLHNSATNNANTLTALCLVDGEATSNTFVVDIAPNKTVAHLMEHIKTKLTPRFDELSLWRVMIPISDIDDDVPILLNNVSTNDKKMLDPATCLSIVFPDGLPDESIHVIVQHPSELSFLRCVPDAIIGEEQESNADPSPSLSTASLSPVPRPWDILHSVRSMELGSTPRYMHPQFMKDRTFRSESMLHDLFRHDLGSVKVLPPFAETAQSMRLRHGKPDLVCLKTNSDPNLPESVLFPIEIECPAVLWSDDLVHDYLEDAGGVAGPVNQIYGDMRLNGYRYGILSTYEQTWFMKRGDQGANDLMISPAIAFNISEPSLLQCYMWFIRQANADERPLDPPDAYEMKHVLTYEENNERQQRRDAGSKKQETDTFEAFASPSIGELEHEARVYQKLKPLQGRYIPKLLLAGVADGMQMALVTDFVGTDVRQEFLDAVARRRIRKALFAIHKLGVAHGNIELQNIVMRNHGPGAKSYMIVNFEDAEFTEDKAKLRREAATLRSLLRNSARRQGSY